ncbi:hypothetical protein AB1L88_17975 [Tautonia sp. JC769]|uniref:hypothetical protein n=1 Tax=Tautonia sp. JC769 TaxID=3232135 RepID=UPI00345A2BAB
MGFLLLAERAELGWSPRIGDPSIMGWLTVVAYFLAAIACGFAARAERRKDLGVRVVHPVFWKLDPVRLSPPTGARSPRRRALFWWILVLALVLLGVNKQLDLQSLLTAVGRRLAQEQGWYQERQAVQRAFIAGVAIAGAGGLALLAVLFRSVLLRRPLAAIGLVFLYTFVLIRAASFHHVDAFLKDDFLGIRMNWLLELGGISCVLSSAIRVLLEARRGTRR